MLDDFEEIFAIVESAERVEKARKYVANCLDDTTPSHEISLMGIESHVFQLYQHVPEESRVRFTSLVDSLEEILEERGYRTNYKTYQEHEILGSTVWEKYAEEPHKPIGLINGDLTIEEAQKARELARYGGAQGKFFGLEKGVKVSLETLDEEGNTVRDPQVLDDMLNPVPTTYGADFPFSRL